MVPGEPSEPVQIVNLGGGRARSWRLATILLATAVVVLGLALALTLPRASAYTAMIHENFELKARLEATERKLSEVDRILLRLRLYEAQLESLGGVEGGAGPIEGNRVLEQAGGTDGWAAWADHASASERTGFQPAPTWASGIESRTETLLQVFESLEPDLAVLVEELESLDALDRALPSFWPAAGFQTSGFGWRRNPLGWDWKHHSGLDIGGQIGDPIWSAAAGTVRHAGRAGTYGKLVTVDHGFGVTTYYAHCSNVLVRSGQRVRRGQQLAMIGNTGRSTGPHLHFEVRLDGTAVDPLDYLPSRRGWLPPWRAAAGD